MIRINGHKDRLVGVLGLGLTGHSTARALIAGGAHVIAWDDQKHARKTAGMDMRLRLRPPDHPDWCGMDLLAPSPGIAPAHDLIRKARLLKIPVLSDVELFSRALAAVKTIKPKIIAITGTNGKSTVTALVADVLRMAGMNVQMGGNIGIPVLSLAPPQKNMIYVLEISSYQADLLETFAPSIAVQLNVSPDHTEYHGSLAAYADSKAKIFSQLGREDRAIIGDWDEFGIKLAARLRKQTKITRLKDSTSTMPVCRNPRLAGTHNRRNIKAAWAVARAMRIKPDVFAAALENFSGLPHRMEDIAKSGAVRFVDDSKATNAAAARQALQAYQDIYWLAGGAAKPEGFAAMTGALSSVRHAYLFGAAARRLEDFLGKKTPCSRHRNLRAAVRQAARDAQKNHGGVVLLSPACASFDEFDDFAARGRAFSNYVREHLREEQKSGKIIYMAAGGTGGGLFPAESLAQELRRRGVQTILMTDHRAKALIDRTLWDRVYLISSAPIAQRPLWSWPGAAVRIGFGVLRSVWILAAARRASKLVIGFGGYPSLPPLLAAIILRLPIVIHEPGLILGRANQAMMRFADRIAASFPIKKTGRPSVLIGNPVRESIMRFARDPYQAPRKKDSLRLMVFAGSQGARIFDDIVPQAIRLVASTGRRIRVVQQCRHNENWIKAIYRRSGVQFELAPFFEDLPRRLADAHLVVARAGASTISELAALGRPAILIPITGAAAREQQANAENFSALGAAWVIAEENLTAEALARQIESLIDNDAALKRAASAARRQGRRMGGSDAAAKLADLVEGCLAHNPAGKFSGEGAK